MPPGRSRVWTVSARHALRPARDPAPDEHRRDPAREFLRRVRRRAAHALHRVVAKRLANSHIAGLLTGLIFATMVGGPRQYFILGGSFESFDRSWIDAMLHTAYA